MNYYNDNDLFCASWLEELIKDGLIPAGTVDWQSIVDVNPNSLSAFRQCHFFAGIGGWSEALRLANWPADQPVWTGSCPCQPFSIAGKRRGFNDDRDLWPAWFRLIAQCRPEIIFGEQLASAIKWGWLDRVCDDLGGEGYTVRAEVWPACSEGAPHLRYRLFWVAQSESSRCHRAKSEKRRLIQYQQTGTSGNADLAGLAQRERNGGIQSQALEPFQRQTAWSRSTVIHCLDGKYRQIPVEPTFFPLVNGLSPARVGSGSGKNRTQIIKGVGNAIVPHVAAEFIKEAMIDLGTASG